MAQNLPTREGAKSPEGISLGLGRTSDTYTSPHPLGPAGRGELSLLGSSLYRSEDEAAFLGESGIHLLLRISKTQALSGSPPGGQASRGVLPSATDTRTPTGRQDIHTACTGTNGHRPGPSVLLGGVSSCASGPVASETGL